MRTVLASLLVLTGAASADPGTTVTVFRRAITTEPAPRTPVLTRRAAPPATVIIDVIGDGDLCQRTWTAAASKKSSS